MRAFAGGCLVVFVGCWLTLAAASAGGWPRFLAALIICAVGAATIARAE